MENTNLLNQNIKDLENFPKIYKSLELKLKEKVENLKGIDTEIGETEKNLKKGNFNFPLPFFHHPPFLHNSEFLSVFFFRKRVANKRKFGIGISQNQSNYVRI